MITVADITKDKELIKQLRDMTDKPLMQCKKALDLTNDNLEKAAEILRTIGVEEATRHAEHKALVKRVEHVEQQAKSLEQNSIKTVWYNAICVIITVWVFIIMPVGLFITQGTETYYSLIKLTFAEIILMSVTCALLAPKRR